MMKWITGLLTALGLAGQPTPPPAAVHPETYKVAMVTLTDEKAVFATIESGTVVPARVRTGGTILDLRVRQGDRVQQGDVIATIGDQKLSLEAASYAAQVRAAEAQLAQARAELERGKRLLPSGSISQNALERLTTASDVAANSLNSLKAQRAVVQQREKEGLVLAPTSGRVITVPVTAGTVAMAGDVVATVAEQNFVLRLQVPERHARFLKTGDSVRLDGGDLGLDGPRYGAITLVYPQVLNGHVVADATVPGLADTFLGQRVRVWVPAGERPAVVVPETLLRTSYGIDYARVWTPGGAVDAPVQRGKTVSTVDLPKAVEILSGLAAGDELLRP